MVPLSIQGIEEELESYLNQIEMFGINNYIKFMKYFLLFSFFFFSSISYSFGLPKCNGDYSKHCSGVVMHPNGEKYIGK